MASVVDALIAACKLPAAQAVAASGPQRPPLKPPLATHPPSGRAVMIAVDLFCGAGGLTPRAPKRRNFGGARSRRQWEILENV